MNRLTKYEKLRIWRRRLLISYLSFIAMFGSSVAMAASGVDHTSVLAGVGVSTLLALPLFIINIVVHHVIQALKPGTGSVGIKQIIISCVFFTAIEAALILPVINLIISRRLLRAHSLTSPDNKSQAPPR